MPDLEEDPSEKTKTSPPPILRRRRNLHHMTMHEHRTDTPDSGNHSDYLLANQNQDDTTPSTPIKQLPFSPSQFFNNLSPESSWPRASTPKRSPGPLSTPQPSDLRRNLDGLLLFLNSQFLSMRKWNWYNLFDFSDGTTPRTPTPFKNALAELERRSGAATTLPATPSRLDALTEIIKQETDRESSLAGTSSLFQDSGYSTGRRRGKENSAPGGGKRARKALCQAWSNQDNSDMNFAVETPVNEKPICMRKHYQIVKEIVN